MDPSSDTVMGLSCPLTAFPTLLRYPSRIMRLQFRAEQVGSLLRPPQLLRARAETSAGIRETEDRAILAVLEKQREIGIDILSDGELRRGSWLTDMADAVEGFVPNRVLLDWKGPDGGPEGSTALVAGAKLKKVRQMTGHELPFLKRNANGPFKITVPAPSNFVVTSFKEGVTDPFYRTPEEFLHELVGIVRDEVAWLAAQGTAYIQFDAPYYSHYLDPQQRERMRLVGRDPDQELERGIAGDSACIQV